MTRLFWLLPLALAACADAPGPCAVTEVASYRPLVHHNLLYVPAMLEGHAIRALLDTGAQRSVVTAAAVAQFRLLSDPRNGTLMSGVGGQGLPQNDALAEHYSFAGFDPGGGHYPVVDLPITLPPGPLFGGIIGSDMLGAFDLDLDRANERLTVYRVGNCHGDFVPWTAPHAAMPLRLAWETGRPLLPVEIDGVKLTAMLDTGASSSVLDSAAAQKLGLTAAQLAKEPSGRGFGAAGVDFTRTQHRFREMVVGSERFADIELTVLDRTLPEADMLLGEDYLARRRVWISYRTRQMFVTPAGR